MKKIFLILLCLVSFVSVSAYAGDSRKCCRRDSAASSSTKECDRHKKGCDRHKKSCSRKGCNPAFKQLKSLEGSWVGTSDMGGKEGKARVNYRTTSGGTTLVETIFPGTAHEMISTFVAQGKGIRMTHYCMMGNQPNLVLKSNQDGVFRFRYVNTAGINTRKDMYMGELTLTIKDKNHLLQEWIAFEKGKKKMLTTLQLVRVKK